MLKEIFVIFAFNHIYVHFVKYSLNLSFLDFSFTLNSAVWFNLVIFPFQKDFRVSYYGPVLVDLNYIIRSLRVWRHNRNMEIRV